MQVLANILAVYNKKNKMFPILLYMLCIVDLSGDVLICKV